MGIQRNHKNKDDFKSREYYNNYVSITKDSAIKMAVHSKIIKTFFEIVMKRIIMDMYRFHFPGLGYFYLTKNKIKLVEKEDGTIKIYTGTDWKATNQVIEKTGDITKRVVYLNEHTNGYVYSVFWDKRKAAFINKKFYSFIPCRIFKRSLSKEIKNNIKPLNAYLR